MDSRLPQAFTMNPVSTRLLFSDRNFVHLFPYTQNNTKHSHSVFFIHVSILKWMHWLNIFWFSVKWILAAPSFFIVVYLRICLCMYFKIAIYRCIVFGIQLTNKENVHIFHSDLGLRWALAVDELAIFSEFTIGHNEFSYECLLCSSEKFTLNSMPELSHAVRKSIKLLLAHTNGRGFFHLHQIDSLQCFDGIPNPILTQCQFTWDSIFDVFFLFSSSLLLLLFITFMQPFSLVFYSSDIMTVLAKAWKDAQMCV